MCSIVALFSIVFDIKNNHYVQQQLNALFKTFHGTMTSNRNGVDNVNEINYNPDGVVAIAKMYTVHGIPVSHGKIE